MNGKNKNSIAPNRRLSYTFYRLATNICRVKVACSCYKHKLFPKTFIQNFFPIPWRLEIDKNYDSFSNLYVQTKISYL